MKHILFAILTILTFASCAKDDGGATPVTPRRTIMVYFNAEQRNVSSAASTDLLGEIAAAAQNLSDDCNLLVFYDNFNQNTHIYRYTKDGRTTLKDYGADINASDPKYMLDAFKTMTEAYPAPEYITVFWGHGTGPYVSNKVVQTSGAKGFDSGNIITAFGDDSGNRGTNDTWINIPEIATVFTKLPKQNVIMFDACLMQSVEVTYELKDYADYIIGACSETPDFGGNYKTLIPVMDTSPAEALPEAIIDDYTGPNNAWGISPYNFFNNVVMSAIKTAEMNNLADATKKALETLSATTLSTTFPADEQNATNCIYYFKTVSSLDSRYTSQKPFCHDLKDVMRVNLSATDFATWNDALESAVIYKHVPEDIRMSPFLPSWYGGDRDDCIMKKADFRSFYVCNERCGGISMFIPNNDTSDPMNSEYMKYKWWQKVMP